MPKLDGRVALVTGASRGIGAAVAVALAEQGANVAVNYLQRQDAAEEVVARVKALGNRSGSYAADVADLDQVRAMVQVVEKDIGPIDVLVNNAGVHKGGRVQHVPPEDFALVLESSVKGAFHCSRMVVPGMVQRGWGKIINVTSVMGIRGWPGDTAYASAKGGLVGFTKALAREVARTGVLVNAVAPGYIVTDMTEAVGEKGQQAMIDETPLGRPGTVEEVAEVVAFIASGATFMTGAVVYVDGGMAM